MEIRGTRTGKSVSSFMLLSFNLTCTYSNGNGNGNGNNPFTKLKLRLPLERRYYSPNSTLMNINYPPEVRVVLLSLITDVTLLYYRGAGPPIQLFLHETSRDY